jgi:type II secretory pathway pseudopilin PulG
MRLQSFILNRPTQDEVKMRKSTRAFSLVEALMVIAIISVLVGAILKLHTAINKKQRFHQAIGDVALFVDAARAWGNEGQTSYAKLPLYSSKEPVDPVDTVLCSSQMLPDKFCSKHAAPNPWGVDRGYALGPYPYDPQQLAVLIKLPDSEAPQLQALLKDGGATFPKGEPLPCTNQSSNEDYSCVYALYH